MRPIIHAVMAVCVGVGVAIGMVVGMVVGLLLYVALWLAAGALLLVMTWALIMLGIEGTAYLITHSHHAKVQALISIGVLLGGFAIFGAAGYVVQGVKFVTRTQATFSPSVLVQDVGAEAFPARGGQRHSWRSPHSGLGR